MAITRALPAIALNCASWDVMLYCCTVPILISQELRKLVGIFQIHDV